MKKALTLVLSVVLILCILAGCGAVKGEPPFVEEAKEKLPYVPFAKAVYNILGSGYTIKNIKRAQNFYGEVFYFIEGTFIDVTGNEELFECVLHGENGYRLYVRYGGTKGNLTEYRLEGLEGEIYITGEWVLTGELGDFEHRDGKFYGKDGEAHYTDNDLKELKKNAAKVRAWSDYNNSYKFAFYQIDPSTIEDGLREVVGHTVTESDYWYPESVDESNYWYPRTAE